MRAARCRSHLGVSQAKYKQSLDDPESFWANEARSTLKWFRDFERVSQGGLEEGDVAWFTGGQLNACYNCVDMHLPERADQVREMQHAVTEATARHFLAVHPHMREAPKSALWEEVVNPVRVCPTAARARYLALHRCSLLPLQRSPTRTNTVHVELEIVVPTYLAPLVE